MKNFIAAALIVLMPLQAQAWGAREQGIVIGAASTIAATELARSQQNPQPQTTVIIQQPPPRVVVVPSPNQLHRTPRPTRQELCHFPGYHARIYDQYDMVMGYRVCY